ncbi:restriction endonuclease subunit S [Acinetobacter parvus]|uniref:restriction endonuclease subunit S n=1 Tax=Acinetobacter parvus TaxID=134533 RepID=UPI0021D28BC3|nr:restriction endonuclease subunit S [Acinetobacter parvus]MCU4394664.1 restriction endonuclease subunit S [Acinetobacter parvus]
MSFRLLGDIVEIKGGKRLPKSSQLQAIKNDHPYIRVRDMGERYLPRNGLEYVPDNVFASISRYIVNTNDLILSIVGTVGLVSIVDEFFNNASLTENCVKLTGLDEKDAKYLYYYLFSQYGKEAIKARTVGAVQPKLPLYNIEKIQIRWFDKLIREKIVNCLSTLDDKIELNNQINQNLESIAQAIFKSWFIDFEPVRAKIAAKQEGKDPERAAMCAISGKSKTELEQMAADDFAELQATAALFPDELVESELGEVPRGWEVGCIGDEVNTVSKTYPLKQVEEVIFLNTGDILEGKFLHANKSRTESLPGQAKKSIQKDDILYSEIRPQNKRFAYVYFDAEDYVVSTKLMVLRKKSTIPSHFVYFILSRQSTIDFLQVMAESRSGTFPQITFDVLSKVEYLKPNNNALIDIFTRKVLSPFFDKKVMNETENNKLIGVRDNLLPKLLSGELDVSGLQGEGA